MPYIDVTVDVDLGDFNDDEIIEELESRGYKVIDLESQENNELTDEEKDTIVDKFARSKPGTVEYEIYEKLRKR